MIVYDLFTDALFTWPSGDPGRPVRVHGQELGRWTLGSIIQVTSVTEEATFTFAPFSPFATIRAELQAWRDALARPQHDVSEVEFQLQTCLTVRGLDWSLQQFASHEDVQAAWQPGFVRPMPQREWHRFDDPTIWPWRSWGGAMDRWPIFLQSYPSAAAPRWRRAAAYDAGIAALHAALAISEHNGLTADPTALSAGLRSAYEHGLAIASPVHVGDPPGLRLGWAMMPA